MTHPLIELQAADTMMDQLQFRRSNLTERENLIAARNALVRWDQARVVARKRVEELSATIQLCEAEGATLSTRREALNARLKTIISPKEAEAVQRELVALGDEQSSNDDAELEAMEEQSRLEAELAELAGQEPALRSDYLDADAALGSAARDIDAELQRIEDRRAALRQEIDAKTLKRYDRLRSNHLIAAAPLNGSRCDGCHLDLSAAEVDAVRDSAGTDGLSECPQCGRLLVV